MTTEKKMWLKNVLLWVGLGCLNIFFGVGMWRSESITNGVISSNCIFVFALYSASWPMGQGKRMSWQIYIKRSLTQAFRIGNGILAITVVVLIFRGIYNLPVWIFAMQFIAVVAFPLFYFEPGPKWIDITEEGEQA